MVCRRIEPRSEEVDGMVELKGGKGVCNKRKKKKKVQEMQWVLLWLVTFLIICIQSECAVTVLCQMLLTVP